MGTAIGRVVIITRPTDYDNLILAHGHASAAVFALKDQGRKLPWYEAQKSRHEHVVEKVVRAIPKDLAVSHLKRDNIRTFPFRLTDLVIAIGPDGLFANIAKYLSGQIVITVDSDPETNDGKLMWHKEKDVEELINRVLSDKPYDTVNIPLLTAHTERAKGEMLAVNDMLVGRTDQSSARYSLTIGNTTENQSSSGILVVTGVGSTGWLSSIKNMVHAISGSCGSLDRVIKQDGREFVYVVREPFISRDTQASLVAGFLHGGQKIVIESHMPTGGVIVSDGMLDDKVIFDAGERVTIGLSDKRVTLVA